MNGWPRKKVSEIAHHSLGKMLDKAKNRGVRKPYLRNLNVRWFDFDLSDVLEMPFLAEEEAKYTAKKGDVLICEGGYPGRAAIWEHDEPIHFQKALHRVRFHEPERNKWFLYYLLSKDLDGTLKGHFNGAGIQHFTGEALAQFEVPLPPLPEQQRIVGVLDEAFAGLATAKANAEKNLQNARALFESHLQSVFTHRGDGWVETTLEEAAADDCSLSYGIVQPGDDFEGGLAVVRPTDLTTPIIFLDGLKRVDPSRAESYRRTTLQGGELLLCVRGSTGVLSKAAPELAGSNVTRGIVPIRFNPDLLDPVFGFHLLRAEPVQSQIRAETYGAALMQINIGDLRQIVLSFPSVAEQRKIAKHLDELSEETQRLAAITERKLAALEALKKSLLHQAFSGQL
jgi:type I restriction enzyme S subunit